MNSYGYNVCMALVDELQQKIKKLEARIAELETDAVEDEAWYQKARELVIKHRQASELFLQRKLLIDVARATKLIARLERERIIGPVVGASPRKVLV